MYQDLMFYEQNFKPEHSIQVFKNNWWVPCLSGLAYLLICFFGQSVMKDLKPFKLKYELVLWNGLLSAFSIMGAVITIPGTFRIHKTFQDTICADPRTTWADGSLGFWVMLFCASKIPELIDTVFIVLRKKPLIFLHWYHHITVMFYCWLGYSTLTANGIYFCAMNFAVHAVMYTYYMVQAAGMLPKGFPAYMITIMQIFQMVAGTAVTVATGYYNHTVPGCQIDQGTLVASILMYSSYLVLFVQFALKRFIYKKSASEKKVQ